MRSDAYLFSRMMGSCLKQDKGSTRENLSLEHFNKKKRIWRREEMEEFHICLHCNQTRRLGDVQEKRGKVEE